MLEIIIIDLCTRRVISVIIDITIQLGLSSVRGVPVISPIIKFIRFTWLWLAC